MTREMRETTASPATAYARIAEMIAADRCVVLDGGTATELHGAGDRPGDDERLWGTRALVAAPEQVLDVHRRYVADRLRRDLDQHLGAAQRAARGRPAAVGDARGRCTGWTSRGAASRLAREAVDAEGRARRVRGRVQRSTATSTAPRAQETIRLLERARSRTSRPT